MCVHWVIINRIDYLAPLQMYTSHLALMTKIHRILNLCNVWQWITSLLLLFLLACYLFWSHSVNTKYESRGKCKVIHNTLRMQLKYKMKNNEKSNDLTSITLNLRIFFCIQEDWHTENPAFKVLYEGDFLVNIIVVQYIIL